MTRFGARPGFNRGNYSYPIRFVRRKPIFRDMTLEKAPSTLIPAVSRNPRFRLKRSHLLGGSRAARRDSESDRYRRSRRWPSSVCRCARSTFAVPRPLRVIENFGFPRSARSYANFVRVFPNTSATKLKRQRQTLDVYRPCSFTTFIGSTR